MQIFSNFKSRVFLAFTVTILTGFAIASASLYTIHNVQLIYTTVLDDYAHDLVSVERLRSTSERSTVIARAFLLTNNQVQLQNLEDSRKKFTEQLKSLTSTIDSSEERKLIDRISVTELSYRKALDDLFALRTSTIDLRKLSGLFETKILDKRTALDKSIDDFVNFKENLLDIETKNSERRTFRSIEFISITGSVSFLLAIAIAFVIGRTLIRLYDEAQTAIRSRDSLIAVVSHDLKNPIAAASLNAEFLLRTIVGKSETLERSRKLIEAIIQALNRADILIRNLLTLDKLGAGHLSFELGTHQIDKMIEETVAIMKPIMEAKSIQLVSTILTSRPVVCDRERIIQVLSNLVGNAVKFTPDKGLITITAKDLNDQILISVKDTGPGIPSADLKNVFNQYWQAKATANKGNGLGLAIAKGFVEFHGGNIWVESSGILGEGCTFYFTLPTPKKQTT